MPEPDVLMQLDRLEEIILLQTRDAWTSTNSSAALTFSVCAKKLNSRPSCLLPSASLRLLHETAKN